MKTLKKTLLASSIATIALSSALSVQAQSFESAYKDGSIDLNLRFRSETSDVDNTKDTALANTLKSRITVKSGSVYGLSALVEADNVTHLNDSFNDKSPSGDSDYNVVLDQETSQFNQAYLQYALDGTTIKAGNQRILIDNQRHVGGVGFRQDEATFDALSVKSKIGDTTVFAAFSDNLNNIKDEDVEQDITLVNAKYAINKELSASAFFYGIEKPNGATTDTFGLSAKGSAAGIGFYAELATQEVDAGDTLYMHFSGSKKIAGIKATLGYESLGSDNGNVAFTTPLGTNHKFLGWSDTFLTGADNNGIQDIYASAVTKVAGIKLVGQYHNFKSVEGSDPLGNEFGFVAAKKFGTYGASLKVAQYLATDFAEKSALAKKDTTKVWLTGTAKF